MTNRDILQTALNQSAIDSGCSPQDFLSGENKVVLSKAHPDARRYLKLPFLCDLTSYGSNIVASVSPELQQAVTEYISRYPVEHCFETPNLYFLMEKLHPLGCNVCFMAEYFLPDLTLLKPQPCAYEIRLLTPEELGDCYCPEWSNAVSMSRPQLDVLTAGAYDSGRLVGLAGASADCDTMWQIGVDVLPQYRKQGIASALTSYLALEIVNRGVVPFYCAAWSNLGSVRNAVKSGFRPSWIQLTVKEDQEIARMNQ